MNKANKTDQLQNILLQVENKFGRGKCSNWKNREFKDLSFEILKSTKVAISPGTLKRIFGKVKTTEEYFPQTATLDALVKYSGSLPPTEIPTIINSPESTGKSTQWWFLIFPVILLVVFIVIIFLNPKSTVPAIKAELKLIKTEGKNPCTAYFQYHIPETKDSVFINFGDGRLPTHLSPGTKMIAHYYEYPGLFSTAIFSNSKRISEKSIVRVKTEGWQSLAYYIANPSKRERYYPVPVIKKSHEGTYSPKMHDLFLLGMDTTQLIETRLDNFFYGQQNGDSFSFSTRLKNDGKWSAVRCNTTVIYITGEHGSLMFKFVKPGCSLWLELRLSEKHTTGVNTDLSNLAIDLTSWRDVRIENQSQTIHLYIDGKQVLTDSYTKSIGNIAGISYTFHGTGSVDYCRLNTLDGCKIIDEGF